MEKEEKNPAPVTSKHGEVHYPYRASRVGGHRTNGPSLIGRLGNLEYSIQGHLHRADGPAHYTSSGNVYYWTHSRSVTLDTFKKYQRDKTLPLI